MKRINASLVAVMVVGGLVACSSIATAQEGKESGKRGPSVEQRMDRLTEQLKLTDEQKPKVKAVLEEETKKMQELRGDSSVSREDRIAKMQSIQKETGAKLKGILTPEQYEKYEKLPVGRRRGPPSEKKSEDTKKE